MSIWVLKDRNLNNTYFWTPAKALDLSYRTVRCKIQVVVIHSAGRQASYFFLLFGFSPTFSYFEEKFLLFPTFWDFQENIFVNLCFSWAWGDFRWLHGSYATYCCVTLRGELRVNPPLWQPSLVEPWAPLEGGGCGIDILWLPGHRPPGQSQSWD